MSASVPRVHPLVLQQLVVLAKLAQLGAKAAVLAAQRRQLTPQFRLQLPVGLKIGFQALHVLLQAFRKGNGGKSSCETSAQQVTNSCVKALGPYRTRASGLPSWLLGMQFSTGSFWALPAPFCFFSFLAEEPGGTLPFEEL